MHSLLSPDGLTVRKGNGLFADTCAEPVSFNRLQNIRAWPDVLECDAEMLQKMHPADEQTIGFVLSACDGRTDIAVVRGASPHCASVLVLDVRASGIRFEFVPLHTQ